MKYLNVKWAVFAPFIFSTFAFGESDQAKLSDLVDQLTETRNQLKTDEEIQRKVLGSLYTINKQMKSMAEKRGRLSHRVFGAEARVKRVARSIAHIEREVKTQRKDLDQRLRALYMMNGQSLMRILFGSQSGQEFDRNMKYLKILSDRDYELISDYQKSLALLKGKRIELRNKVKSLLKAQTKLKKQKKMLLSQQNSKAKLLKHIRSSKEHYLSRLKDLRSQSQTLQRSSSIEQIESALKPSFFEEKGRLSLPTGGDVIQGYGIVQDPVYGFQSAHKGLRIATKPGDMVHSVFAGRVVFEGLLDGYGASLIIDHGDHFYTVYGNSVSNYVSVGDRVQAGQDIALARAESDKELGSIYFEIRHFSEAVDPADWVMAADGKRTQL